MKATSAWSAEFSARGRSADAWGGPDYDRCASACVPAVPNEGARIRVLRRH